MSRNLEYKETVRAVSDRLTADIYQIKGSKDYIIFFSNITYSGKKQLLRKKLVVVPKDIDYLALKEEIREKMFLEAYNDIHILNLASVH